MSIYNEDELVHPSWINPEFFAKVLKQYEKCDQLEIINVNISPASLKGDHYASIMFRCKIAYTCDNSLNSKTKSVVVKTLPTEDGPKRDMLNESSMFETEISMYTEALPEIEKLLAKCGEPTKFSAEIIYHSLEPHKVIIFEDLCESGYDILRDRYLNEDEIKIVYSKIAKLHAASFLLGHSENHEIVTKYMKGIFASSALGSNDLFSKGIFHFMNMLQQHEELKIYLDKLKIMQPEINENCKNLYNAYHLSKERADIFVLNHGDFHMKNCMFKFNAANQAEDLIMVDYQLSCYAPSNIDLIYSQYMLLSPELRLKRNELMHYYFEAFKGMLKKLNFQGDFPRYSDFQIAGLRYRHFSIFLLSTFLPLIQAIFVSKVEDLHDLDVAQQMENPEMAAVNYENPKFIDEMHRLLPSLLVDGYLD